MGLPWFRVDTNIGSHDKILALLSDPSPVKWQAFSSYICALGWSSGAGTDGRVPNFALQTCHGTAKTARLLVKYRLWTEAIGGYQIVNFEQRQQLSVIREAKETMRSTAAMKANCVRWHGDSCWKNGQCSKEASA
jgi:hypothetical protein